jgi:hypothetical protein
MKNGINNSTLFYLLHSRVVGEQYLRSLQIVSFPLSPSTSEPFFLNWVLSVGDRVGRVILHLPANK